MQVVIFNTSDNIAVSYRTSKPQKLDLNVNLCTFLKTQPSTVKRKRGEPWNVIEKKKEILADLRTFAENRRNTSYGIVSVALKMTEVNGDQMVQVSFIDHSRALKYLWERFHFEDKAKVSLVIKYAETKDEELQDFVSVDGDGYRYWPFKVKVRNNMMHKTTFDPEPYVHVKITVDIEYDWLTTQGSPMEAAISFTEAKSILERGLCSDLTIMAGNEAEVKAHKLFLSVGSPVLAAMLQSGMEESQSGRVDMSDMSEEGVKAFLRYLYYGDLSKAMEDDEIAFELLCAGHKYEILSLEEKMLSCLRDMNIEDFDVGLAFKMYMFARNMESQSFLELKNTAVQVFKMKPDELKALKEYQDLFKTTPDAAMEFCQGIINASTSSSSSV